MPENHRGLEGAAAEASLADMPWWDAVMGDEVLKGLIAEAVEKNQDLRVATARVEEYRALAGIAKADYYPWIGYDATASRQKQPIPGTGADPDVQHLHRGRGRLVGDRPVGADPAVERVGAEPAAGDGRGAAGRPPVAGDGSGAGVPGAEGAGPGAGDRRADAGEPQGLLRPRVEEAPRGDLEQAGVVAGRVGAGADRGGDPAAEAGDLRQGEPAGAPPRAAAGLDPAREDASSRRSLRRCRQGCRRRC